MNKYLLFMPILLLFSVCFASAYDSNNLRMYYSFDETDVSKAVDSFGIYNMTLIHFVPSSNTYSVTGLLDKGRQWNAGIYNYQYCYYSINNISYNFSRGFTINMWVYDNFGYGSNYFDFGNGSRTNSPYKYVFGGSATYQTFFTKANTTSTVFVFSGKSNPSPLNHWNMITLVHGINSTQYYINGGLITNVVNQTLLNRLAWNLTFGWYATALYSSHIVTIDEYSVWNNTLNSTDIITLYNDGNGLSFGDTIINGNQTPLPVCIDANTWCSNWGYTNYPHTFGLYYCNSQAESQFCSGGCSNGICSTSGNAECGILGETKCIDTTNYATCDDSNGDGYLDFKQVNSCPLNTYCTQGFHLATCRNVSQSGVHDLYAFTVTPYAVSDDNVTYNINSDTKTVSVNTKYAIHEQKFYDVGVNFSARICNYNETSIYSASFQNLNASTSFTLPSAINQNTILRISILPNATANGSIETFSQSSTSNGIIHYYRNSTGKYVCIQNGTYDNIYCDYDYTGVDTLKSIDLEYTYDFQHKYYTLKMYFSRTYSNNKITYPKIFSGNDLYNIVINTNDTILYSINVVNIPNFYNFANVGTSTPLTTINPDCNCVTLITLTCTAYKNYYGNDAYLQRCSINSVNQVFNNDCTYTSNGVYRVRTYGNNEGTPDYSVYNDYDVFLQGTGLTQQQLTAKSGNSIFLLGSNLTQGTKYIIVLFTMLILIGSFTAIGFTMNMIQGSFTVGIIVSFFALIMFTVFGWLPAWILVALLIVGVASIILISKTSGTATG